MPHGVKSTILTNEILANVDVCRTKGGLNIGYVLTCVQKERSPILWVQRWG